MHIGGVTPLDSHPFSDPMTTLELSACTLTVIDDDIVHAHFKDGLVAGPDAIDEMFDAIRTLRKGRKALFLFTAGAGASLTNEARAHASSDAGSEILAADAIVVRDFGHQMSANAFVRHNKPKRPIQLFPDTDSAIAWLKQHRHLIDNA